MRAGSERTNIIVSVRHQVDVQMHQSLGYWPHIVALPSLRAAQRHGSKQRHQEAKSPHHRLAGAVMKSEARPNFGQVKNRKLQASLKRSERLARAAAEDAERSELLLPAEAGYLVAEGMEQTHKITQKALSAEVDSQTARKMFDLNLPDLGPYRVDFSRNGRHLHFGGLKGHVALLDRQRLRLLVIMLAE